MADDQALRPSEERTTARAQMTKPLLTIERSKKKWGAMLPKDPIERFWAFVDKTPGHGPSGDCWLWKGRLSDKGYGSFWTGVKDIRAQKFSWSIENDSDFPDGLYGCHTCDNPPCVRPSHIFPGTALDNAKDRVAKKRSHKILFGFGAAITNSQKVNCNKGHEFTPANTYFNNGRRTCRICANERRRECERKTTASARMQKEIKFLRQENINLRSGILAGAINFPGATELICRTMAKLDHRDPDIIVDRSESRASKKKFPQWMVYEHRARAVLTALAKGTQKPPAE